MNTSLRNLRKLSDSSRKRRGRGRLSRLLAAGFLLAALGLTLYHLAVFASRNGRILPSGVTLAGIPVGGLGEEQAIARLEAVYFSPITLDYRGNEFQLEPAKVQFIL